MKLNELKLNVSREIIPGKDYIPVTSKLIDKEDLITGIKAVADGWLTAGRYAQKFERKFSKRFNAPKCLLVNSGSSANLVAFYTLTSPKLGERRIKKGDEVITVAAGFPTTISPIIQFGAVPVFVDVDINTCNIDASKIKDAITKKTKAIVLAHTLGNPFDLDIILKIASEFKLWVIEDDCDALGATFENKPTGSFGDISTFSFYPAHHITMGEGGAVIVNNPTLSKIAESFRDWGRDCYCDPGRDNTCGCRFSQKLGDLPFGYDHKYTYSHIGFNLKLTDMQAAIGLSQLNKLDYFIEKRRKNFNYLKEHLSDLHEYFSIIKATKNSDPSWFGFLITLNENSIEQRNKLVAYLEKNKIGTRLLFAGNITKQPGYIDSKFKIHEKLINTDKIMLSSLWIGVWPGLEKNHLDYMIHKIRVFFKN